MRSLADVADEAVANLGVAISEANALVTVAPGVPIVRGVVLVVRGAPPNLRRGKR